VAVPAAAEDGGVAVNEFILVWFSIMVSPLVVPAVVTLTVVRYARRRQERLAARRCIGMLGTGWRP
jgi:hypothetical protein